MCFYVYVVVLMVDLVWVVIEYGVEFGLSCGD